MNRIIKIILILAIIFVIGCIFLYLQNNKDSSKAIELYKGFPVFPPEKIKDIEGKNNFSLEMPEREKIFKEVEKMNIETLSSFEVEDFLFEDWFKEIDKATNYVEKEAENLGWKILKKDYIEDGGSVSYTFVRSGDKGAENVVFTSWAPMIERGLDYINIKDNWGMLEYSFSVE